MRLLRLLREMVANRTRSLAARTRYREEGHSFASAYFDGHRLRSMPAAETPNPLLAYFRQHCKGRGIWKWEHYFAAYHRHLARFVGQEVRVVEVGVHSGGSLQMWRSYFGERSSIYGVDVEESCKRLETEGVTIHIGDQGDRAFWQSFKRDVGQIDVLIDDGGHSPRQQYVTLEEMLPAIAPGGVYLCEDVHGVDNRFAAYAGGLVDGLNYQSRKAGSSLESHVSAFQAAIDSFHFYPYLLVIEKRRQQLERLVAPKRGSEWEPIA